LQTRCNQQFGYRCADWIADNNKESVGFKCQDPANCDQKYTNQTDKLEYSIVCDGYIGEFCEDSSTCNK